MADVGRPILQVNLDFVRRLLKFSVRFIHPIPILRAANRVQLPFVVVQSHESQFGGQVLNGVLCASPILSDDAKVVCKPPGGPPSAYQPSLSWVDEYL